MLPSLAARENSFAQRLRNAPEAKARLAEAAFALLEPGETVFLDASSTTYFLARLIAERGLARAGDHQQPAGVAGALPTAEAEVVGDRRDVPAARRARSSDRRRSAAVRDHFADRLFMSVTGVTPSGVMTDADVLEAEVKRAMLEHAEQSVLLLDESKLAARGRQAIAPVSCVSIVLADGLAANDVARLEQAGPEVRSSCWGENEMKRSAVLTRAVLALAVFVTISAAAHAADPPSTDAGADPAWRADQLLAAMVMSDGPLGVGNAASPPGRAAT